jgi:hypothetical protein
LISLRICLNQIFFTLSNTKNENKKTNGKDKFAIAKFEKNLIVTGNINDENFYPETIINMNFNSGN